MAKLKNSTASEKNPKKDILLESLIKIEQAGSQGLALAAPDILKDRVSALNYNPKGNVKQSEAEKLSSYLMLVRTENFQISKPSSSKPNNTGKAEKATKVAKPAKIIDVPVNFYTLSQAGQDYIANYYIQERQRQEEIAKQEAGKIEGIQQALNQQTTAVKILTESVEKVSTVGQRNSLELAGFNELKQEFGQKISNFGQHVESQISMLPQQFQTKVEQLKQQISQEISQLTQEMSIRVNQEFGQLTQELTILKSELGSRLNIFEQKVTTKGNSTSEELVKLQSEIKEIKTKSEVWTEAIRQSSAVQSQVALVQMHQRQLAPTQAARTSLQEQQRQSMPTQNAGTSSQGQQRQLAPTQNAGTSLPEFESKVVAQILALVSTEIPKLIETLYLELHKQGFSIRAGHLNDLLWALHQQGKLRLQLWIHPVCDLPSYDHAIFRPDSKVYAYIQKI